MQTVPALGEEQHSCHGQLCLGTDWELPAPPTPRNHNYFATENYQEEIPATVQGWEFPRHTKPSTMRQSTECTEPKDRGSGHCQMLLGPNSKSHVKCFPFFAAGFSLKPVVICSAQRAAAPAKQGRHFPHTLHTAAPGVSTVLTASHTDAQGRKDGAGTSTQFPEEHTMGRGEEKGRKKKDFKPMLPAPEQMAFSHPSHPFDGK